MKNIFLFIFCAALFCCGSNLSHAQELVGTWQGRIQFFGQDIRMVLHFKQEDDSSYSATADSPDQGSKGKVVDEIEVNGDSLKFEISEKNVTYAGKYFSDSS